MPIEVYDVVKADLKKQAVTVMRAWSPETGRAGLNQKGRVSKHAASHQRLRQVLLETDAVVAKLPRVISFLERPSTASAPATHRGKPRDGARARMSEAMVEAALNSNSFFCARRRRRRGHRSRLVDGIWRTGDF